MPVVTDRVIALIETQANTAGIEKAQAGFAGLNVSALALGAALGVAIVAGKSMIDISEKHEKAQKDLAQAITATGGNLTQADAYLQHFIDTNRAYLSDQAEVTSGYATLLRSGVPVAEAQKDMNRALDLAALKNISVSDATALLVAAEHGRTRGLIDLGITTTKYTDAQGNVINQGKNMALVMAEIDQKTKNGKDSLTDLQKETNILSNDWQDLANHGGGKVLLTLLDTIVTKLSDAYNWFDKTGKDDKLWATINDRLVSMAKWIKADIEDPLARASNQIESATGDIHETIKPGAIPINENALSGRAAGGPVIPGQSYTVGEMGPETLTMGRSGGYVTPGGRGGGRSVNVTVTALVVTPADWDRLANELARRLTYATGS